MSARDQNRNHQILFGEFSREDFRVMYGQSDQPIYQHMHGRPETTHRDGQQGGLPLTTEQSLRIYDIYANHGQERCVRQRSFLFTGLRDKAALQGALERYQAGAPIEPTTWIRASAKDVELIRPWHPQTDVGLASDYHTFHKFKPADAIKQRIPIWTRAGDGRGRHRPRLHLEDRTAHRWDFMLPFVEAVHGHLCAEWIETQVPRVRHKGLGCPMMMSNCRAVCQKLS